jgi:hypothetical protein
MKINKNFNNMTDQEKWDFVHAHGGYVSRWGLGIDIDLESFKDIQGNTLTIDTDFANHMQKLKKIARLEEEIRQLQNQISDLRFIIKKDGA